MYDNDDDNEVNSFFRFNPSFPNGKNGHNGSSEIETLKERIARLENTVAYLRGLIEGGLLNREKEPVAEAKEEKKAPEEDKIVDRYALCAELVRLLIELNRETVLVSIPKLSRGDKTDKPRVYFTDDNSFLYFDKAGRIYPGAPTLKCKGKTARYVLGKLYKMRDYLPSPLIQAALIKSQFNAAVLE
jgi:hypothetical protein